MRGWLACLMLLLATESWAKEPTPYPPGDSQQAFEGIPFDLRVPPVAKDGARPGLVFLEPGALSDLDGLAGGPYVVVAPSVPPDRASGLWSAGEVKVLLRLVEHVTKAQNVDPERVHAVAVGKTSPHDIFEMLVFRKRSPFAAVVYVRSSLLRTSVPGDARKRTSVLAYDWEPGPLDGEGVQALEERFGGKVRRLELRQSSEPLADPYLGYWLHVAGGGYRPGHDLSLPWAEVPKTSDELKAALAERATGGLVYVHADPSVAEDPLGRVIQDEVFFEPEVRGLARRLLCLKLDAAAARSVLGESGQIQPPALVVLDAQGGVRHRIQGTVKAKQLVKALEEVVRKP